MKTQLLLLVTLLTPALACDSHQISVVRAKLRGPVAVSLHATASPPTKQPPAAPSSPAPKPADKDRGVRPARPAYLFL